MSDRRNLEENNSLSSTFTWPIIGCITMRPAFEVEFYRPSMATDWCTWPEPSRAGKEKKTKKKRKENEESTRGTFAEFPRAVGVEGESFERRKKKETVSLGKEKKP